MSSPGIGVREAVVVLAHRERARHIAKDAFPRRHTSLSLIKTSGELVQLMHHMLIDAVVVDLGATADELAAVIPLAREYPSIPFIGLTPLRPSDVGAAARCAQAEFAELAVETVDDHQLRLLVQSLGYSARFALALAQPPEVLGLNSDLRRKAWQAVVSAGGRPVRTDEVAAALGITREHLSRAFSGDGAPNIKRIIDLVRLISAAELAKNPAYDIGDVAEVLGFASSSHLSTTSQRVVGTRPTSLARLRAVDLFERFVQGRTRSRSRSPSPGSH